MNEAPPSSDRSPRFIYFDAGNVLLHFDLTTACRQIGQVAGVAPERVSKALFESDLEARYERGELTTPEFYEQFCQRLGVRPEPAALMRAASDIFELNLRLIPIAAQLQAAGRPLGVLSNTNPAHWEWIVRERFPIIDRLFDVQALSFRIGAMKPEPRIYRAAAELAGEPLERLLLVDDRPENIEAARRLGMDGVLFTTPEALAAELRRRGVRFNY